MKNIIPIVTAAIFFTIVDSSAMAQAVTKASSAAVQGNYKSFRHSSAADKALAASVWKEISRAKGLEVGNVNVAAKDNVVLLVGRVPDRAQIEKIGSIVQAVPYVKSVINDLVVWPATTE